MTLSQERLLVLAGVFTMALGVSLTLSPGVLPFYGVALAVLACAAVPYLLHTHPDYSFWPMRLILPAGLALAAPSVAHALGGGPFRLMGVFGPGALLYAVILAEYLLIGAEDQTQATAARLLLSLTAYAVVLAFFLMIYEVKERSLISGTLVALASGAVSLRLLTLDTQANAKLHLYGIAAGLTMAEVLWSLNYWVLGTVAGGMALLVAFYVVVGLMRQLAAGELDQAVLVEYGTVSLAGALVVLGASRL
jgi:Protein of unknown function (DUF5656)